MNMGERIHQLRKERGISMEELGMVVGVGKAAVHIAILQHLYPQLLQYVAVNLSLLSIRY